MSEPEVSNQSHSRRLAREVAFQTLYMQKVGNPDMDSALAAATSRHQLSSVAAEFVQTIVKGINETYEELDGKIAPLLAGGWTLGRIAISDHVVLQIAAYELFHLEDMPPKVTISQAVDLAKRFGSAESGAFVNGVLGNLLTQSPKADWEAPILVDPELEEDNVIVLHDPDEEKPEDESEEVVVGSWVIKNESDEPI
ncbi:MAG: transcription antitermination factor NusB [Fimbriimonadaceae bacterium]